MEIKINLKEDESHLKACHPSLPKCLSHDWDTPKPANSESIVTVAKAEEKTPNFSAPNSRASII